MIAIEMMILGILITMTSTVVIKAKRNIQEKLF